MQGTALERWRGWCLPRKMAYLQVVLILLLFFTLSTHSHKNFIDQENKRYDYDPHTAADVLPFYYETVHSQITCVSSLLTRWFFSKYESGAHNKGLMSRLPTEKCEHMVIISSKWENIYHLTQSMKKISQSNICLHIVTLPPYFYSVFAFAQMCLANAEMFSSVEVYKFDSYFLTTMRHTSELIAYFANRGESILPLARIIVPYFLLLRMKILRFEKPYPNILLLYEAILTKISLHDFFATNVPGSSHERLHSKVSKVCEYDGSVDLFNLALLDSQKLRLKVEKLFAAHSKFSSVNDFVSEVLRIFEIAPLEIVSSTVGCTKTTQNHLFLVDNTLLPSYPKSRSKYDDVCKMGLKSFEKRICNL